MTYIEYLHDIDFCVYLNLFHQQMLGDALYKSSIDQLVKEMINTTDRTPVPTYYYLLNTTLDALKLPYWREVSTYLPTTAC